MSQLTSTILPLLVDGLAMGVIFAVLGVGITLIFGLGEILNIAHGTLAVSTVLIAFLSYQRTGSLLVSLLVGFAAIIVLSLIIDRTVLSFAYRQEGEQRLLMGVFVTLGLTLALEGVLDTVHSSTFSVPVNFGAVTVAGVLIRESSIVTIAVGAFVLTTLFQFLNRTYLGKAMRTLFQTERGALLCGINPRQLRTIVFVISTVLAGIAGVLYTLSIPISVSDGFELTIFGLIVSIVGGTRSVQGAVFAGIGVGVLQTFINYLISSYMASMLIFTIVVVFLIVDPEVTV